MIWGKNLGCEGGEALHKLPREALADPGSLKLSKARLVGALEVEGVPAHGSRLELYSLQGPSNPNHSTAL